MTQLQTYAMYALAGAGVFLLVLWLVVRSRSRKRRELREEAERRMLAETRVKEAHAVKDHMEHVFGRRALYKREMAQRELDRYYGKGKVGPDPTYAEWAAAKGLPVDEADEGEEVPAG